MTDLRSLQREAFEIAEANGFHEDGRSRPEVLALIHGEVSEALEADRVGDDEEYAVELADIVIRVFDHAEEEGIDLESQIVEKNAKNRERDYKHGKRY